MKEGVELHAGWLGSSRMIRKDGHHHITLPMRKSITLFLLVEVGGLAITGIVAHDG